MFCKSLVAALFVSAAGTAGAAPTYIDAGRLIAVPGQAVRGPSTIIVDGTRIVEAREGIVAAPAGAALIDLSGQTVLPGLIDAHVHRASDRGGEAELLVSVREEQGIRATDGLWASHWYDTVAASTSFGPPDKGPVALGPEEQKVADACRADYDTLSRFSLRSDA